MVLSCVCAILMDLAVSKLRFANIFSDKFQYNQLIFWRLDIMAA